MPLSTGKECIILEGFGDKICKLIDEKLKSFLDDGGILHEEICISSDESIICEELEVEEIVQTKTSFRATKKPIQTVTCSSTEDELVNIEPSSKGESLSLIEKHNITLNFSEPVIEHLAEVGYDSKMGARPLARKIDELIRVPLSKKILFESIKNANVMAVLINDEISFEITVKQNARIGDDGIIEIEG
jgi:hypothetical protein